MTDDGKKKPAAGPKKGVAPDLDPVTTTPEEAFQIYLLMEGKPSLPALTKELQSRGIKISPSTVTKWSARFSWPTRREMALEGLDPGRINAHLQQILALADLDAEAVLQGAINSFVQIVVEAARTKPPDHVRILADVMNDVLEMKGKVRSVMKQIEPPTGDAPAPPPSQPDSTGAPPPTPHQSLELGKFKASVVEGGKGAG